MLSVRDMKTYTVSQLAKAAGVTPRTLRHYHAIGLLSPSAIRDNGYRSYTHDDLLRLQQILFYRELDVPLPEIKRLLERPGFDVAASLRFHLSALEQKRRRLGTLINTIHKTLDAMDNNRPITEDELYEGFPREEVAQIKQEASDRWGHTDAYKQSQQRVSKFTKQDWEEIKSTTDENLRALVALLESGAAPDSPETQAEITKHYAGIGRFYDCSLDIYRGLADMYLADQRFADTYRKYHKDLPEYLVAGMRAFCDARA